MPLEFPSPPRRILLIKPSAIGDVVHALPVLNLLRRRWPEAHIAWLVTPACSNLLDGHPMLNEVILFERGRFGRGWREPAAAAGLFSFLKGLRHREFDLVVDLQGLFRSGWMTWQTRAPVRIGFANAREFSPVFYTHRVDVGDVEQHAIDRYLKVTAALGCGDFPVEFPFYVTEEDRRHVDSFVPVDVPYAVLIPGTNWRTKRWPIERFAALVKPLRERFGLATVAAGSPDEMELAGHVDGINAAGKTTLRQLAALLERASLVVANDSGPMHIAAALGRPLVTPFGPTNPIRTGPYRRADSVIRLDIPCSPCYSRKCSHQSCLQWLDVESVLSLAEKQMRTAITSSSETI
ncbi:MAG: heptosyltransferase [Phycisphaerales bacterium]|nr:heptosyltransferase [Phycisphaerales bacterium]